MLAGAGILIWKNSYQQSAFQNKVNQAQTKLTAQQGEVTVELAGYAFKPDIIKVKKGTKVTWINHDNSTHTVTSDQGSDINSQPLKQGDQYQKVFDTPGIYRYHCEPHPNMIAAVIVEE